MRCIYCSAKTTEVSNSRKVKSGSIVWRRRSCQSCDSLFTTKESAGADNLFIVKRSHTRQRFVPEKLFASLFVAINTRKNRDNGDDAKLAKKLTDEIINILFRTLGSKRDVKSATLILASYSALKKINQSFADHYLYYSDYRMNIVRSSVGNRTL